MNTQIEVNNFDYKNKQFIKAKYFGYEVLINNENKYINITKLLKSVNCKIQWKNIKRNDYYINYYNFVNGKVVGSKTSPALLEYTIQGNQYNNHISGTYVHPKLLNFILIQVNPEYAWYVSEIMEQLNNNNITKVQEIVEDLKTKNEQLQKENEKLKSDLDDVYNTVDDLKYKNINYQHKIESDKPKLIPVKTNELETNVKIKIYETKGEDNKTYKISYDQNRNLNKNEYKLIQEIHTNSASNIVKSDGLKQYYVDKKTRVFKSDNLNDVIKYLNSQN